MAKLNITPPAYDINNVQSLPDQPIITRAALKLVFDQVGIDITTYLTDTFIAELNANNGAFKIGMDDATITANNVGDALIEIKQEIIDVVLGQIPDGSLTDVKLSNTAGQIKDNVSTNTTDIATLDLKTTQLDWQVGSVTSRTITIVKPTDLKSVKFQLEADITTGTVIQISDGTTSLPLKNIDEVDILELEKGFYEVIADATFFTLRPSGDKKLNYTLNLDGEGSGTMTLRVDVTGSGVLKNIFNGEPSGSYSFYYEIDGVRYPSAGSFLNVQGSYNLINIEKEFNSSFKFYSTEQRMQCVYTLNGVVGHSPLTTGSQSVSLSHEITGKGLLVSTFGGFHSVEIDGSFLFGSSTIGRDAKGQYWNVEFSSSVKLYTRALDATEQGIVYKL